MSVQTNLLELDELIRKGDLPGAEQKLLAWIEEAEQALNPGAKLTFLNELTGIYRSTGRADAGCVTAEEALKLIPELGAEGSEAHAASLVNAATVNLQAGNLERSMELYDRAAAIYEAPELKNTVHAAALFNNMSGLCMRLGDYEKARGLLEKALEIVSGSEDCEEELASTHVNLSHALMRLGRLDEAEASLKKAFAWYSSPRGSRDPHAGAALAAYGELELLRGDYGRSLKYYQDALQVTENYYGRSGYYELLQKNIAEVRKKYHDV